MFCAYIFSIFIVGDKSNQVSILLFYVCITIIIFIMNILYSFRKPYTYIYSISIENELITIKFRKLFNNQFEEVNINDIDMKLEIIGKKNLSLKICGFNNGKNFCIEQPEIFQWKKKLLNNTYDTLDGIITSKTK